MRQHFQLANMSNITGGGTDHALPRSELGACLTINSTALPKVALISPPIKGPHRDARLSEASDMMADNGMMGRKLKTDTRTALHCQVPATKPRGAKASKMFTPTSSFAARLIA
jgi:hypothetical protein